MTTKFFTIFIGACLAFQACIVTASASGLIGKEITVKYENGAKYKIQYGKDKLTWSGLSGVDEGRSETNEYQSIEFEPEIFLVRWKESDGTIIHSIINLSKKNVITSIHAPNPLPIFKGSI